MQIYVEEIANCTVSVKEKKNLVENNKKNKKKNHGNNKELSTKFCCKWNKQEIIKEKRDNVHSLKCFRKWEQKIVYNIFVHTVGILKEGKFKKQWKKTVSWLPYNFL